MIMDIKEMFLGISKKTPNIKIVLQYSGLVLFFLMMTFPRSYQLLKIPFLLIYLIYVFIKFIIKDKLNIDNRIFRWFVIYLTFGFFWGAIGLYNKNIFASDFIRLNIIWILIYFLFVLSIDDEKFLYIILRVMVLASLAISVYNINYYLYSIGAPSIPFIANFDAGQRIGIHPGYVQLTAHNIGTLNFLVPFLISGVFLKGKGKFLGFNNIFLIVILLLNIVTVILSGRRVLWFITFFSPFLYLLVAYITKTKKISWKNIVNYIGISVGVLILFYFVLLKNIGFDLVNLLERLTFSGSQSTGISYRLDTTLSLISDLASSNILIGNGGGSPAFEIIFIQLAYETGIIGVSIFLWLFIWTFINLIKIIRSRIIIVEYSLPVLVGFISFFISLWSNPYFGSFDFMWTLFLPLTLLNLAFRNNIKHA